MKMAATSFFAFYPNSTNSALHNVQRVFFPPALSEPPISFIPSISIEGSTPHCVH